MARLYQPKPVAGADDLEILHPERSVPVAGDLWTVREYSLRDGARYAAAGRKALEALDRGDPAGAELVTLIAFAVDQDPVRVAGTTEEELSALVKAWRELNASWFKDEPPIKPKNARRWSEIYATLIARGHPFEQIQTYTLRQVKLFMAEADRAQRRARADRILDVNAGTVGGNEANRLLSLLQR